MMSRSRFIFSQVPNPCIRIYASSLEKLLASMQTNSVDVGEPHFYAFFSRKVDAGNTCHVLSLPLLVLRVAANHAHDAFAANHLAPLTSTSY